ncbi:MAG TPA: hypothetical protein VFC46_14145, partial [Humisphaera sp.]|nr:hypothetical protein [Humisphaera sp.]
MPNSSSTASVSPRDRWSLTSYFSSFGADDYTQFKQSLERDLGSFLAKLQSSITVDPADILTLESLTARLAHLDSYLGCLSADDAMNDAVKADEAWTATLGAQITKIDATISTGLAQLSDPAAEAFLNNPALAGATYAVRRMREKGRHLMPPEHEALAADLNIDGMHAWGRLYQTLSGRLEFPMTYPDGHVETTPMAMRRALMASPDRRLRAAAFAGGQAPWETHGDTFAAALNGIAGARLSLY